MIGRHMLELPLDLLKSPRAKFIQADIADPGEMMQPLAFHLRLLFCQSTSFGF